MRIKSRLAEVIPLSAAFPRGLFVPYLTAPCAEHRFEPGSIDLQGLPGPLPTLRCLDCRAVEVLGAS